MYMFYDNVHLAKNIRNNLLNAQKFVFPSFSCNVLDLEITFNDGYIAWSKLHRIYDEDALLDAKLRKPTKVIYKALHLHANK